MQHLELRCFKSVVSADIAAALFFFLFDIRETTIIALSCKREYSSVTLHVKCVNDLYVMVIVTVLCRIRHTSITNYKAREHQNVAFTLQLHKYAIGPFGNTCVC